MNPVDKPLTFWKAVHACLRIMGISREVSSAAIRKNANAGALCIAKFAIPNAAIAEPEKLPASIGSAR